MITRERLVELLSYSPVKGEFRWKRNRARTAKAGDVAGTIHRGYCRIRIDGTSYLAHRLAWLHEHGAFPLGDLDHINGDRSDNRLSNLREATASQNLGNSKVSANNVMGLKGVHKKTDSVFVAQISINRKSVHLGYFSCPAAAHFAYQIAADQHFGEFARRA